MTWAVPRVGLLGCGVITQRTLPGLIALLKERGGRVSALCDPLEPNRRQVAGACAGWKPQEYASVGRMLAESDANVVFVATPIGLHDRHVHEALASGRHVYCHKTLTGSARTCRTLEELAAANRLRLAASPGQMLLPVYARAREIVVAGTLGEIVSIETGTAGPPHRFEPDRAREQPRPGQPFSWEWYHSRKLGGGPLDDMFVYPLAFLTALLGDVTHAAACARLVAPVIEWQGRVVRADAADSYSGMLRFGNVVATFHASFSSNGRRVPWGTVCIRGTESCLEVVKQDDLAYWLYQSPNGGAPSVERFDVFDREDADRLGSIECHVLTDMAELLSACQEDRQVEGATVANAARVARALALIKTSADMGGAWADGES